jgi:hypothetical protein
VPSSAGCAAQAPTARPLLRPDRDRRPTNMPGSSAAAVCCGSHPARSARLTMHRDAGRTPASGSSAAGAEDYGHVWPRRCIPVFANSDGDLLVGHGQDGLGGYWSDSTPAGPCSDDTDHMKSLTSNLCAELGITEDNISLMSTTDGNLPYGGTGSTVRWCLYRCSDPLANHDAKAMIASTSNASISRVLSISSPCSAGAEYGHQARDKMSWRAAHKVLSHAPERRSPIYRAFGHWLGRQSEDWITAVRSIDFSGRWERDPSLGYGVHAALLARGHTEESAATQENKTLVQDWVRSDRGFDEHGVWEVTSYNADGVTPRLILTYPLRKWEELHGYDSALFGPEPGVVQRRTMWLPEPNADASGGGYADLDPQGRLLAATQLAHVTVTRTQLGVEESRRYLRNGALVLRRSFLAHDQPADAAPVVSEEVLVRRSGGPEHSGAGQGITRRVLLDVDNVDVCTAAGVCPCRMWTRDDSDSTTN